MPIGGRARTSAGQRNRHVLIEQCANPLEQWPTWTPLTMAWMFRDDESADEQFASDQISASVVTEWQMDYRADMDPELFDVPAVRRLVYEGRTYEIRRAAPLGWKRDIALFTLARVG